MRHGKLWRIFFGFFFCNQSGNLRVQLIGNLNIPPMEPSSSTGLLRQDIKRLLQTPESDLLGEIIRLNQTRYGNTLDVIRICTNIRSHQLRKK